MLPSSCTAIAASMRRRSVGIFMPSPEGRLDTAAVNAGLKALYATGLFEDVRIAWSGSRLIVTVAEAPVIDRVQFEGNKQLKDKDLVKEIRSKAHTPLIKAAIQDDVVPFRKSIATPASTTRRSARRRSSKAKAAPTSSSKSRRARRPESGRSSSSEITPIPTTGSRGSSRPANPAGSASSRPPTSTNPTRSNPTATCCAPFTSRTASPTPRWSPRPAPMTQR